MLYKLGFILLIISSCNSTRMIETSLYFGQSKPTGGMVTADEWNGFKDKYVSKVFKEGSTVVSVTGNWYDTAAKKLITEPTYVIISYHKKSASLSKQIDSLRYWYKKLFDQQSVLRVDKKLNASF